MQTLERKIRIICNGQTVFAEKDQTLLEALIGAGIFLRSDCGGKGRCGKCRVKMADTDTKAVSAPDDSEIGFLGEEALADGDRLACRVKVLDDTSLEIPETSRLSAEVAQKGPTMLFDKISDLKPPRRVPSNTYGLAVDLGTTTIAAYLCDLAEVTVMASLSVRNPQAMFGDDVMSRISAISIEPELLARLQRMAVKSIEWAVNSLCRSTRIDPADIKSMVVVGNTTMIHIVAGEDPSSIGVYPYEPKFTEKDSFPAETIGFRFNPITEVRTLPLITGFIGSDIVSATLAADLEHTQTGTMLVDVGTNGEIMLLGNEGLVATSCATGPAFEGAAIRYGMQAVSGAIDAVKIDRTNGEVNCSIIQKNPNQIKKPGGICGTGVLSAVAELLRAEIILANGNFNPQSNSSSLHTDNSGHTEFILIPADKTQNGYAITLTQKDVRAVQLAKGALRTGIDLLCRETGIEAPTQLLVAGAFGSYIDREDALTIGMFPNLPVANIEVVGNAAGAGAILTLFDEGFLHRAKKMTQSTRVLDLSTHPEFQDIFIASLSFPDV